MTKLRIKISYILLELVLRIAPKTTNEGLNKTDANKFSGQ